MADENPFGDANQTLEDMVQSLSRFNAGLSSASKETKFFQTQLNKIKEAQSMFGGLSKEMDDFVKNNKKATESLKKNREETEKNTSSLNKFFKTVQYTQRAYGQWVQFFGGSTITLSSAKKELLSYNQGMFDLSRKLQVSGGSMKGIDDAFKKVKSSTALSKNEFLEFANSATKVWKGTVPTTKSLADLSSVIQQRVGPGTRELHEALSDLGNLMSKMPALANTMANAMIGLENGEKGASEKLKSSATALRAQVEAGNISLEEYEKYSKLINEGTKAQKGQIATNEQLKKTAASTEDAMLELGKSIEEPLRSISKSLEGLMNMFQKMPAGIAAGAIAFKGLGTAMNMASGQGKGLFEMISKGKGGLSTAGSGGIKGAATKIGGRALGVVGAGLTGFMVGRGEYRERLAQNQSKEDAKKAGWIKGGLAGGGALGGAAAGAAIGSVVPVIGTAVGGIVGGIAGGIAGGWLGEKASDAVVPEAEAEAVEDAVEETANKANDALRSFLLWKQEYEQIKKLAEENVAIQEKLIDMVSSYGDATGDKLSGMIEKMQQKMDESIEASKKSLEAFASGTGTFDFSGFNIVGMEELQAKIDQASKSGNLAEVLQSGLREDITGVLQKEIEALTKQRDALQNKKINASTDTDKANVEKEMMAVQAKITALMTKQNTFRKEALNVETGIYEKVKKTFGSIDKMYEGEKNLNQAYQERLDLEKDLMEAAQFGMGASVEMMQKQIDMAYELIELEKERGSEIEKQTAKFLDQTDLSEAQKANIKGLIKDGKSQMHITSELNRLNINDKDTRQVILESAKRQQEVTSNQLKQQKKIYEITKDVREGYLDALREMSTGFGEFEKIIGTQDTGVSQLMDAVNKYNSKGEEGILDTMGLGGYNTEEETKRGVGFEITGGYSAAPGDKTLHFIGGQTQDERNARLRGYDPDFLNKERKSTAGGANALNDKYEGALRGSELTPENIEKANKDGTKEGVLEALTQFGEKNPINIGARRGQFRESGVSMDRRRSITAGPDFGASVLNGASVQNRADPSALVSGGRLNNYGLPRDIYGENPAPTGISDNTGTVYKNQNLPMLLSGLNSGSGSGISPTGNNNSLVDKILNGSDQSITEEDFKNLNKNQIEFALKMKNETKNFKEGRIKSLDSFIQNRGPSEELQNYVKATEEYYRSASLKEEVGVDVSSKNNDKYNYILDAYNRNASSYKQALASFEKSQNEKINNAGSIEEKEYYKLEKEEAKIPLKINNLKQKENREKKHLDTLNQELKENKFKTLGDRYAHEEKIKKQKEKIQGIREEREKVESRKSEIESRKSELIESVPEIQKGLIEDLSKLSRVDQLAKDALFEKSQEGLPKISAQEQKRRDEITQAQHLRQSVGNAEGLSESDIYKKLNQAFIQGGAWETMSEEQRIETKKRIEQASKMKYKRSNLSDAAHGKLAGQKIGENGELATGGVTSVADEKGFGISEKDKANYMQAQGTFSQVFGSEGDSPVANNMGGMGGMVKVFVSLAPDLTAKIESHGNVISELNNATVRG